MSILSRLQSQVTGKEIDVSPTGQTARLVRQGREAIQGSVSNAFLSLLPVPEEGASAQTAQVPILTGAERQRQDRMGAYAQLADDRRRGALEAELYQLTQPGRVYNQETTARNQARAQEIEHELSMLPARDDYNPLMSVAGAVRKGLGMVAQGGADTFALAEDAVYAPFELVSGLKLGDLSDQGFFNQWADDIRRESESANQFFQENMERGGKPAELLETLGASAVAAIPQAGLALATAGGSAAAQTAGGLSRAAASQLSPGVATTVRNTVQSMSKNPQFWTSFSQVVGSGYEDAIADQRARGETDENLIRTKAALFAIGNGLLNSAVEVGGGIETLPAQLQSGGSAWRSWVDSMVDEGKEEVVQGVIERALQNPIYQQGNPFFSTTDPNAILNPATAAQEFAGGAVVGGLLGGGQIALQRLAGGNQQGGNAQTRRDTPQVELPSEPGQRVVLPRGDAVFSGQRTKVESGQQEAVPSEVESTSINTNPEAHTRQEQQVIEEYQDSADVGLAQFYESARRGEIKQPYRMKPISDRAADEIQELTGKDVHGFSTIFEPRIAQHIYKDHGENGRADQSMRDPMDVSRMQYIIDHFDTAEDGGTTDAYWETSPNGRNRRARTVVFSKKVNGTYYVVEAAPITKAKSTYIVSAYMSKTGASRPTDANTPVFTAKTENASAPVSDLSISQNNKEVNPESSGQVYERSGDGASLSAPVEREIPNPGAGPQYLTGPESSVGGAREGFDPWSQFQLSRSEFLPEGANAARPVDVPTTDPQGRLIRRTASTAMGAKAIPDEAVADIQNMVLRGELSYQRAGDKASVERARRTIEEKGYQRAMEEFSAQVRKGVVSKDMATLGQQLLLNAANAGDGKTTAELLSLYAQMETSAGQAVQAASILRKLAPDDQLYAAVRDVSELEKTIQKRYKDIEITIDPALMEEFAQQTDQAGRDRVLDKIYQNVAGQIPANWKDKWNAWRYLAMLANPRTHVRNVAGNVFFQPLRVVKDRVAAAIEAGVSAAGGGKLQRTKAFAVSPELYRAAWADWDNVRGALSGNKYNDVKSEIESRRRIFRLPPLEAARTANSWALEFEDSIFKRITYADALAGYLQANGVTAEQMRAAQGQQKTASGREAANYRAVTPENVELPTVPIINLSMRDVAAQNGGVLPRAGNTMRRDAISRARKRLGLDQNSAVYIPASNVTRNGEEYVLKITKSSLDKMLSPSNGGIVPAESIAVLDNLERIANNGVYFKSEGDRKSRDQIAGYDHLMTTVYLDGQPYTVDMRVRVYDSQAGGENRLYYFTPEEIMTTRKVDTNIPTGTLHERAMIQDDASTFRPTISQPGHGVNLQPAPGGRGSAKSSTERSNYGEIEPSARVDAGNAAQPVYAIDSSISKPTIAQTGGGVNALPPELLARARDYAGREALRATYQDRNAVSDKVVEVARALGPAGEAVLPFKRTPANILVRGMEYSPAGLAKALTADLVQVRRGNMTGAEAIDHIAAGLTGSALFALGAYLFAQGIVTSGGGDDENLDQLNELTGGQSYALNLPDGTSVTLDWLAPEALPFFMGVELMDSMGQSGNTTDSILTALKSISDPMLELSMLQSLNDVIDSVSFSENKLGAMAASSVISYFTQAIPTIGGQIERSAEDVRMSTYTDKNLVLPTDIQYALGRASSRIPGWDYQQIPYIDAWGRNEESGPLVLRMGNNFINPAYTSRTEVTPVDEEVRRLYNQTGNGGVVPDRAPKYFTVDGERVDLTAAQYTQYATERGQTQLSMLEELFDRPEYNALPISDKAALVEDVYEYADALAKAEVSDYEPDGWVAQAMDSGVEAADYLIFRAITANITGDKDENGDTISGSKKEKMLAAIDMMDLSEADKDALYYASGYSESTIGEAPWRWG